jgi:hypothetical protein
MSYDPKESRDKSGKWSAGGSGGGRRWGRMNSTEKAKLTASAQFSTATKSGKSGKLPTLGKTSPRMQSPKAFQPSEPNTHAVSITTAKNLDKDFHNQRQKAEHAAMAEAIAKSTVKAIKYPSKKPRR